MNSNQHKIFNKVVNIGPSYKGEGGISAVLCEYHRSLKPAHLLPTNSLKGRYVGIATAAFSLLRLIGARIKGRRIVQLHYAGLMSWKRKKTFFRFSKFLGFKTIMYCHTDLPDLSQDKGKSEMLSVLGKTDCNIVLASVYKKYAEEELGLGNVVIVNNPISFDGKRSTNLSHPVTFLFLGMLNQKKGVFDIIEAAKILKNEGKSFRIILGGSGPKSDEIQELIEKYGLKDNFQLPGWIKGNDKLEAFGSSHVLLLPSYSEGMPMCILEAKCASMPAISTRIGAISDIISDGKDGFLIHPGDIDALASAMRRYIDNPALIAEHGEAALTSSENFKMENIKECLAEIYSSLLSANPHSKNS